MTDGKRSANTLFLCVLAAVVMAHGWGYRGITGSEKGAMVAGAMLGVAVCLGSNRPDWHRRAAVAGFFGSVGWAWGGSFSYMEQTFYTVTDSFPDVIFGYSCLFLLGALWAGIGGAVLGLAFTLPRSRLQKFVGPFAATAVALFLCNLILPRLPDVREHLDGFMLYFRNTEPLPVFTILIVSGVYALVRPKERSEAVLFFACAVAWIVGYLTLTKFGGLVIGPPYRLESWSGILGVLVTLIVYLILQNNRAALMVSLYGAVGGGLAFAVAVFVRHPVRVMWGPFATWHGTMQWKIAEESFGLFMGLAIALALVRLARKGLAPAAEDVPARPLDVFSAFFVLVPVLWLNLQVAPAAWIERYKVIPADSLTAGLRPWTWCLFAGLFVSAIIVYALYLYGRGTLSVLPHTAYGKGTLLLLILMWATVVGSLLQHLASVRERPQDYPLTDATFMVLVTIATIMVLSRRTVAEAPVPDLPVVPPEDPLWNVGIGHAVVWASVPVVLLAVTGLSMAMQDGAASGARLRFGPKAYWREATAIVAQWKVVGFAREVGGELDATKQPQFARIDFQDDFRVTVTLPSGEQLADAHNWGQRDGRIWLYWNRRDREATHREALPMTLAGPRIYIPWPQEKDPEGYWVLEKQ